MSGQARREVEIDGSTIRTPRLLLRPWEERDAAPALAVYGERDVARWLAPAMDAVGNAESMAATIRDWQAGRGLTPDRATGRWAIEDLDSGTLVGGGQILGLPPGYDDLQLGYQFAPAVWGRGYGSEAGHALAHYAFANGEDEIFAVVRPRNAVGIATALRIGMEWVGETDKYYDLHLRVYRLRKADLDRP